MARYSAITNWVTSLGLASEPQVLEIGPESTRVAEFVRSRLKLSPHNYHCIELSATSFQLLSKSGTRVEQLDVSTERFPWPTETFDLVIASEVLEHLLDPDHALEEVHRVLRRGGIFLVTTPNLASWFNRLMLLSGRQPIYTETGTEWVFGRAPFVQPSRPVGHLQVMTLPGLIGLLVHHRFSVEGVRGVGVDEAELPGKVLRHVDSLFARFPSLSAGLMVACRVCRPAELARAIPQAAP